jgi:hypothetical protein
MTIENWQKRNIPNSQQLEEDVHGNINTMKGLQGMASPTFGSAG